MNSRRKYFCIIVAFNLLMTCSCGSGGIGGVGWDDKTDIETARKLPPIESSRILITKEEVPYQTFKQEFDTVFKDFQYSGIPVGASVGTIKTQITGTQYSVEYENFMLRLFRENNIIAERRLPNIFYMHPVNSAALIGKARADDWIICSTNSRATTGLHYILILDGNGEVLFEKIVGASEDWDILPGNSKQIIIGGAQTKITISPRE